MKKTRLFLALFLTLVAVFGLIACGDNNALSGEANEWGYTPVRISYASVQGREGWDYTRGDAFARFHSERFNYELEFAALNWDNWAERLRIWISSMDMPDVAVYDYNHTDAASYVEQGLVYRFPDNWQERWPNAARFYNLTSLGPMLDELFGGTYFYPRARFADNLPGDPLQNHYAMWFRKDWMEAVGFPIKSTYTIPEILDFARLIKQHDPGNVGMGLLPITGSPGLMANLFLQHNSTHYNTFYWDPVDRAYKWGAANPRTLEGLRFWYTAFSEGLLDAEFYLMNIGHETEKFNLTQQAASYLEGHPTGTGQTRRRNFERDTGGLNGDDHIHSATVLGSDGYYHQRDLINYWGAIIFSPTVSTEVFERWMDLMDFRSTREGYLISQMGLLGEDWDYGPGGNPVSLNPPGFVLSGAPGVGKYSSMGYILGTTLLNDDFSFDNPNIDEIYREESRMLYRERALYSTPETFPRVDWTLFTYDSPNMRRANFDYTMEFANMVTNATSMAHLEQLYNNWINGQMGIIQPVLNELNALRR